jgi:hypothetical protein
MDLLAGYREVSAAGLVAKGVSLGALRKALNHWRMGNIAGF